MPTSATVNTATCHNPGCTENGIVKPLHIEIEPSESVFCGACRQPCTLTET